MLRLVCVDPGSQRFTCGSPNLARTSLDDLVVREVKIQRNSPFAIVEERLEAEGRQFQFGGVREAATESPGPRIDTDQP